MVDDTTRHRRDWLTQRTLPPIVRLPQARFWPAANGIVAVMGTVSGVRIDEVTKVAPHLANAWGCIRVNVMQLGRTRPAQEYLLLPNRGKEPESEPASPERELTESEKWWARRA
jgi:hypothetical protein